MNTGLVAVVPYSPGMDGNEIFSTNEMFKNLKKYFNKKGYEVCLYSECKNRKADYICCFSFNFRVLEWVARQDAFKVYFAFEPPVVVEYHTPTKIRFILKYFNIVLTPFDSLIDNIRIFKCDEIKNTLLENQDNIKYEDKKLLCNISGYKYSLSKDELYTKRLAVIKYFQKNHVNDFTFYGQGKWKRLSFCNYGGKVSSKSETYHHFKFALALENAQNVDGYVSEKIIDCFLAGIVPIYMRSGNIDQYIPKDCYIDYGTFDSVDSLLKYLYQMNKETYMGYLERGKRYILSEDCERYKENNYLHNLEVIIRKSEENIKDTVLTRVFDLKIERVKHLFRSVVLIFWSLAQEISFKYFK